MENKRWVTDHHSNSWMHDSAWVNNNCWVRNYLFFEILRDVRVLYCLLHINYISVWASKMFKFFFIVLGSMIFSILTVGTVISQSGYTRFFLISFGNSQASMLIKNVEREDKVSYLPFWNNDSLLYVKRKYADIS